MQYEPNEFFYEITIEMRNNNKICTCRNCNICLEKNLCCNIILKILLFSKLMRIFFKLEKFIFL